MLEIIGAVIVYTIFGFLGIGGAYCLFTFIRDDRRSEKERKEKQKNAR